MSNKKKSDTVVIAAGWDRTSEKNPDFQFTSLRFVGGREEDEFEVIVRRKGDGAELLLNEVNVILTENGYKTDSKEDSKKPDRFVRAFIDEN